MPILVPSDEFKFKQVYEKYYKLSYSIILDILKNKEDAEEVLQDSFIRVAKNISKIADPFSPQTKNFVVIISKNTALTFLKRKKEVTILELDDSLNINDEKVDIEEEVIQKDIVQLVKECIVGMPEKYSACLYLELVEEYDIKEIANILDMKYDTVKKRLWRAKNRLKKILKERGVDYED